MFLLTATLTAFGAALPMSSDVGKQAALDQQVSVLEGFGMQVSDEQYAAMQKGTAILPYQTAAGVVVWMLLVCSVIWPGSCSPSSMRRWAGTHATSRCFR